MVTVYRIITVRKSKQYSYIVISKNTAYETWNMGPVSPQSCKNKAILSNNFLFFSISYFYSLSSVKRKRGNVDFARRPNCIRSLSLPVCISIFLLHAGKSPVAIWYRLQSLKEVLSKNLSDSLDTFGKSCAEYCEKRNANRWQNICYPLAFLW